jgi:hypothetical protein
MKTFDEDDGESDRVEGLGEERREKSFVKWKKRDNIGVLIGIENLFLNNQKKKIIIQPPKIKSDFT